MDQRPIHTGLIHRGDRLSPVAHVGVKIDERGHHAQIAGRELERLLIELRCLIEIAGALDDLRATDVDAREQWSGVVALAIELVELLVRRLEVPRVGLLAPGRSCLSKGAASTGARSLPLRAETIAVTARQVAPWVLCGS